MPAPNDKPSLQLRLQWQHELKDVQGFTQDEVNYILEVPPDFEDTAEDFANRYMEVCRGEKP